MVGRIGGAIQIIIGPVVSVFIVLEVAECMGNGGRLTFNLIFYAG
jgi:hypothetical protein